MSASSGDVDGAVRARLRRLRHERALTLDEMGRRLGVDGSTVSRLESGRRSLRVGQLPAFADALGVQVQELFEDFFGADAAAPVMPDGKRFELIAPPIDGGLRICRVTIPGDLREPSLTTHAGHQRIYVLSGRLRLVLGADERVLRPGDCVAFDTTTPHWTGAVEEAVALLTIQDSRPA